MTINTTNLKQLESTGGTLKASSAASIQSPLVKYRLYDLTDVSGGDWYGSVNFVQDQLGVFVILSVGTVIRAISIDRLNEILDAIPLPISLNTRLEVYTLVQLHKLPYTLGIDNRTRLVLQYFEEVGLRLHLVGDTDTSYQGYCTCIRGLIPGAYLHNEDTTHMQPLK